MKQIVENILWGFLTALIFISMSIPIIYMFLYPGSQWVVFKDTWFFPVYAVVLYVVGSSLIKVIFGKE